MHRIKPIHATQYCEDNMKKNENVKAPDIRSRGSSSSMDKGTL